MEKMLKCGHARRCDPTDTEHGKGNLWYLPHHGVSQTNKGKIRVVFDCSARYANRSLNDELLQGPDLTNGLLGVLLRFRENTTTIMADIESMFYQVKVPVNQRCYQRFIWWPNGDTEINQRTMRYVFTPSAHSHLRAAQISPY